MNRNKSHYQRWMLGFIFTLGVSALIWGAVSWAKYIDLLTVHRIDLSGFSIIQEKEYRATLGNIEGSEISKVNLSEIGTIMEAHPYIRAARISRRFPNTLKIEIVERTPLALVNLEPLIVIDDEGVVLPPTNNVFDFQIPCLSNFNSARELYPIGKLVLSQKVTETISLLRRLREEYPGLYINLSEIRLNHQDEYELILSEEPTQVVLGTTEIWNKLIVLQEFERTMHYYRRLADYTYLDLRYKNQVIVRERRI